MLIAALFATAKKWRQPKCPLIEKWIKKLLSNKKNEIITHHEHGWT